MFVIMASSQSIQILCKYNCLYCDNSVLCLSVADVFLESICNTLLLQENTDVVMKAIACHANRSNTDVT